MENKNTIAVVLVIVFVIAALMGYYFYAEGTSSPLDPFAQCLKDKGTVFYGAFWCPHCGAQKKLFGKSEKLLPYVECSTPDARGQLKICEEKGVNTYPTWEFSDGSRTTGEMSLEALSEKTGCALPQ